MVEGLNVHYRMMGKSENFPGVMVQSEAPLLVTSEVALVDPSDKYIPNEDLKNNDKFSLCFVSL